MSTRIDYTNSIITIETEHNNQIYTFTAQVKTAEPGCITLKKIYGNVDDALHGPGTPFNHDDQPKPQLVEVSPNYDALWSDCYLEYRKQGNTVESSELSADQDIDAIKRRLNRPINKLNLTSGLDVNALRRLEDEYGKD